MAKDTTNLLSALETIAGSKVLREKFIAKLIDFDAEVRIPGTDVRETITGPIVDFLFAESEPLARVLEDGTRFEFIYRSKIAREFVMCPQQTPDHVWEPQTTKLLCHLATRASNALIGGAYFGDHAIMIAQRISGACHAFEPNPDQRSMLIRNARINDIDNLTAVDMGLWDNDEASLTLVGYDSFAHPEISQTPSDGSFRTTSIDGYCKQVGVQNLGLLMMDIEGAELRALKGAAGFLGQGREQAPAIVFEVHKHYVDWSNGIENAEIIRLLASHGYQVWAIRDYNSNVDMRNEPVELIPCDNIYLEGPPHGFNMLALKDTSRLDGLAVRYCSNVSPKLLLHRNPALHQPCHSY